MVVDLYEVLPVILYLVLIILVIVTTIFILKLFKILKKVDNVLDNIDVKANQLNGLFSIVDNVTDAVNSASVKMADFIYDKISKLIDRKDSGKDE